MGFLSDSIEMIKDIKEGTEELFEVLTKGFVEMVIKDNNDYQTSYEKRNDYIDKARKIERKISEKQREASSYFENLHSYYDALAQREQVVLKKCRAKIPFTHAVVSLTKKDLKLSSFTKPEFSALCFDFGTNIGGLLGADVRNHAVDKYIEDVNDFEVEANKYLAETDAVLAKAKHVMNCMVEETEILNLIENAILTAKKMNYTAVYKLIEKIIITPIVKEDCTLSMTYRSYIDKLKGEL